MWVGGKVCRYFLVRLCLLIALIKCLKGHKSFGNIFVLSCLLIRWKWMQWWWKDRFYPFEIRHIQKKYYELQIWKNVDCKLRWTTYFMDVSYSALSFADCIWTMIAIWQVFLSHLRHQRGNVILQQIFRVSIAFQKCVILVMIRPCVKCYSGEEALNI